MAVTWPGDLHMDTPAALPTSLPLDIKSLETTVIELPQKCTSSASSSPSVSPSSSPKMEPKVKRIDPPPTRSHSHSHSPPTTTTTTSTTTRPRTNSRPTSATGSAQHSRSNSRSNPRSRPPSRHGSLHSSRRAVTTATASIVPVPPTRTSPHERRESLLALHRESCRLFQDLDSTTVPVSAVASAEDIRSVPSLSRAPSSTYTSRREGRSSSETGHSLSSPPSPVVSSQSSHRFDFDHRNSISSIMTPGSGSGSGPVPVSFNARDRSNTLPNKTPEYESFQNPSASSIHVHVPATVTEWTSPSSRRAEYEKIDRAGRGVRGLWRRVAPRWCQSRDARTPFFEEGITSSSREGSVRRFRMDLPDEELDDGHHNGHDDDNVGPLEKSQTQMLDFLGSSKNLESGPRRWTYRRTKTSPA